MDDWYDSSGAALLWLLMLPGVLPTLAAAVLVFGFSRAARAPRPWQYRFGVIVTATALVCFALVPTYAKYIHARQPDEEWFWQAVGLGMPFLLLITGLSAIDHARKPQRDTWL